MVRITNQANPKLTPLHLHRRSHRPCDRGCSCVSLGTRSLSKLCRRAAAGEGGWCAAGGCMALQFLLQFPRQHVHQVSLYRPNCRRGLEELRDERARSAQMCRQARSPPSLASTRRPRLSTDPSVPQARAASHRPSVRLTRQASAPHHHAARRIMAGGGA